MMIGILMTVNMVIEFFTILIMGSLPSDALTRFLILVVIDVNILRVVNDYMSKQELKNEE